MFYENSTNIILLNLNKYSNLSNNLALNFIHIIQKLSKEIFNNNFFNFTTGFFL